MGTRNDKCAMYVRISENMQGSGQKVQIQLDGGRKGRLGAVADCTNRQQKEKSSGELSRDGYYYVQ